MTGEHEIIDVPMPDGNAFAIIGCVKRALCKAGRRDECVDAQKRMMSGDYNNVLTVAQNT